MRSTAEYTIALGPMRPAALRAPRLSRRGPCALQVSHEVAPLDKFDCAPACWHDEVGAELGGLDLEAAARLSGSRFAVLRGSLARLVSEWRRPRSE